MLPFAEPCLVAVKLIKIAAVDDRADIGVSFVKHIHHRLFFGSNGVLLVLDCRPVLHEVDHRLFLLVEFLTDFRL